MKHPSFSPRHTSVLVIDDESHLRSALEHSLTRAGFEVTGVGSGAEAVELQRSRKFDVALAELEMPDMDGMETLAALKERDPGLEVVLGGMETSPDAISDFLQRGAFAYLYKPYHPQQVVHWLTRAREHRYLHIAVNLHHLGQRLLTPHSSGNLAAMIVDLGAEFLGAEQMVLAVGYPLLQDEETVCSEPKLPLPIEVAEGLAQQAYAAECGVRLAGGLIKPGVFGSVYTESPYQSALAYPLSLQGQLYGALIALRTKERPDFTWAELSVGERYAELVAMALENEQIFRKLQNQAITDETTGLFSRRFLFESLWQHLKRLGRIKPSCLSCLIIHAGPPGATAEAEGSRLARKIAQSLCRTVRGSDVVARYGAFDYAIVLPQTDLPGAKLVADKLLAAIATIDKPGDWVVHIGISATDEATIDQIRSMKDASDTSARLLSEAEEALKGAMEQGRAINSHGEGS